MKYEKSEKPGFEVKVKLTHSVLHLGVSYPKENPENFLDDVVDVLEYIGAFEGLKQNSTTPIVS